MRRLKKLFVIIFVLTLALSVFGTSAWAASARYAVITDVSGTVQVKKAGGSKEIRVFKGMGLNEGDSVKVSKGSSLTLKVADQEDEIVLGENWNGVISKLKETNGGKQTSVKTWSGSMYSKVNKLSSSKSTYKVETPTAVMGVRGTHYTIVVDPGTGLVNMFVHSGQVGVGQSLEDSNRNDVLVILPAQQFGAYSRSVSDDLSLGVSYAHLDELIQFADNDVITAILENKEFIDRENMEQLESLPGTVGGQQTTLDLTTPENFQSYQANVDNALFNMLNEALQTGVIPEEQARDIIDRANQMIADQQRQYDLNREVPPINPNAAIDQERERQRQEQQRQAQERLEQQQQQREQQRQQIENQNQQLLQQIQQQQQQIQQQNQQLQGQQQQEALNRMLEQMNEEQRQQLLENVQQREQEREQQEEQKEQTPAPVPDPAPTPGSTGGTPGSNPGDGSDDGSADPIEAPELTLEKVTHAHSQGFGFDVKIKLDNFTGDNSVYGVELHFISPTNLGPYTGGANVYYNESKFGSETTADNLKPEYGFYDVDGNPSTPNEEVVETIYALTVFGAGEPAAFDNDEVFAVIPFHGHESGSLKLAYAQIVDENGDPILTLSGSGLPAAISFDLESLN